VDPTQIAFYKQLAYNNNVSLDHECTALMNYAYSQGWFGMSAPEAFKILLTPAQYRELQQAFARDIVTGEDVMTLVSPPPAEAVDDFALDTLKG
jgi:predicted lactoylglutathione lyase